MLHVHIFFWSLAVTAVAYRCVFRLISSLSMLLFINIATPPLALPGFRRFLKYPLYCLMWADWVSYTFVSWKHNMLGLYLYVIRQMSTLRM